MPLNLKDKTNKAFYKKVKSQQEFPRKSTSTGASSVLDQMSITVLLINPGMLPYCLILLNTIRGVKKNAQLNGNE